jgi:ATP-GRASP peptide maturase of grasp-with-spasm system
MVLICSNQDDVSTTRVQRWLLHYKVPFRVLLENNAIRNITMNGQPGLQTDEGDWIMLEDVQSYWYRRGINRFRLQAPDIDTPLPHLAQRSHRFFERENASVATYIEYLLGKKKHINDLPSSSNVNKLLLCDKAAEAGFQVPETLVTTSKAALQTFMEKHGEVITKPIETQIDYLSQHLWLPMYTEVLTQEQVDRLPEQFNLSLFQQKITKKYELRVFCFDKAHYAMAIFSQRDKQTAIDFRKYNMKKPNRNVPFQLPAAIGEKIERFLALSGYDCGSLDLLVNEADEYFFLEINPVGQFGMVSAPCHYKLERKIADYLSSK